MATRVRKQRNDPLNARAIVSGLLLAVLLIVASPLAVAQVDDDGDGVDDSIDNCLGVPNPGQEDADGDNIGDSCDPDPNDGPWGDQDFDTVPNQDDECPGFDDFADADGDGIADGCDPDPNDGPFGDADGDGVDNQSDACPGFDDFADADGDGIADGCDADPTDGPLADADGDGVPNQDDQCEGFDDALDVDGDGIPDGCDPDATDGPLGDADSDGVANQDDQCAGFDDALDADGDGIPDDCDADQTDGPLADQDGDGVANGEDNCPAVNNPDQSDVDEDLVGDACEDVDEDGTYDPVDNCPSTPNPDQADKDGDGVGDVCDDDLDGDTVLNVDDNCPTVSNVDQADVDEDLTGDACEDADGDGVFDSEDNCPADINADQADIDGDAIGDVCDVDSTDGPLGDADADGVANQDDSCPGFDDALDADGDGIPNGCDADNHDGPLGDPEEDGVNNEDDNCPDISNPDQLDTDGDGIGDVCDPTPNGPPAGGGSSGGSSGGGSGSTTTTTTPPSPTTSATPTTSSTATQSSTTGASATSTGTSTTTGTAPPPVTPAAVIQIQTTERGRAIFGRSGSDGQASGIVVESSDGPTSGEVGGTVKIRYTGNEDPQFMRIVLVDEDGNAVLLAEGTGEFDWDSSNMPDGVYTIQFERQDSQQGFTTQQANGFTIVDSRVVVVRNAHAAPEAATLAVAVGTGVAVVGGVVASRVTVLAEAAKEAATAFAEDSMKDAIDERKGASLAERLKHRLAMILQRLGPVGRALTSIGVGIATAFAFAVRAIRKWIDHSRSVASMLWIALIVTILFSLEAMEENTVPAFLAVLPIVGLAALTFEGLAIVYEALLARATGARVAVKLYGSGIFSLGISSIVFHSAFGYPGFVDEQEDGSEPSKRVAAIRAIAVLASALSILALFIVLGIWSHDLMEEGMLVAAAGLCGAALPVKPLPGHEIWAWNKAAGLGMYLAALAVFMTVQLAWLSLWAIFVLSILGLIAFLAIAIGLRLHRGARPMHDTADAAGN